MTDDTYAVQQHLFLGICVCLSALVTFAVNLNATCYLLVFKRGSFSTQAYNNLLMGLQATMGVCLSLSGYPWTAAALLTGKWPAARLGCLAATFCLLFFGSMNVLITLLMSVERLIALNFPYRYKQLITYERIVIAVVYLFAHGTMLASLPLFLDSVELTKEPFAMCLYSLSSHSSKEKVVVHAFVINFSLCLMCMLVCNICVIRALKRMNSPISATAQFGGNDRELVIFSKMTGMMACAYVLCWLPVVIRVLLIYYTGWRNTYFDICVFSLSSADPFVHPVTCLIMSKRYRDGYLATLYKFGNKFRETCHRARSPTRVQPAFVINVTQDMRVTSNVTWNQVIEMTVH